MIVNDLHRQPSELCERWGDASSISDTAKNHVAYAQRYSEDECSEAMKREDTNV